MKFPNIDLLLKQYLSGDASCDLNSLQEELARPENSQIREELLRFKNLKSTDLLADGEKMWACIEPCREAGKNKRNMFRLFCRYAAVIIFPLLAGLLWMLMDGKENEPIPKPALITEIAPGKNQARLVLANGEQVDLPASGKDTILFRQGATIVVDSFQGISYQNIIPEELTELNRLVVPRAGEYRLVLVDGTVVWLNSESELRFPTTFAEKQRKVYLSGEAYFQVAKNSKKPFIVEVDDMEVEVLGTEFNINAYSSEGKIFTTLVRGSIQVGNHLNNQVRVLTPHQQAEFLNGQLAVKEVDVSAYISWIQGKFYFDSTPLEQIAKQLQRWYDLDFFFAKETLKTCEFTGVIRRDHTANEIFRIIEKTTDIKFELNGHTVIVR